MDQMIRFCLCSLQHKDCLFSRQRHIEERWWCTGQRLSCFVWEQKTQQFFVAFYKADVSATKETHLVEAKQEWEGVESPSHLHVAHSLLWRLMRPNKVKRSALPSVLWVLEMLWAKVLWWNKQKIWCSEEHQQELRRWRQNQEYRSNHHRMVLFLPPPLPLA